MIIEKSSTSKKKDSCSIPRKSPTVFKNGNSVSVGRVRGNKNGIELISEIIPFFYFCYSGNVYGIHSLLCSVYPFKTEKKEHCSFFLRRIINLVGPIVQLNLSVFFSN